MKELIRTNDPVKLSYATALLAGEGIESVVFDSYSSFAEGTISAVQQRLMVIDEDMFMAEKIISSDALLSESLSKGEGGTWS